jgi:DNA replication protein DnaC
MSARKARAAVTPINARDAMAKAAEASQALSQSIDAAMRAIRDNRDPQANVETEDGYCGKCSYGWLIGEDGRARPCACIAKRRISDRQKAIDELLHRHRAGMAQKLARVSAHTFIVRPGHEHIRPALDQYIRDIATGKRYGFFIYGRTGVGKTWAAAYIINTLRHLRLKTAALVNFSRVLSALRQTFGDDSEHQALLDVLYDTPVLAFDDLGMEYRTNENPELSWAVSEFYKVIDYRREEELSTIITTNRTPEELADRMGEAIMTRIRNLTLRLDIGNPGE